MMNFIVLSITFTILLVNSTNATTVGPYDCPKPTTWVNEEVIREDWKGSWYVIGSNDMFEKNTFNCRYFDYTEMPGNKNTLKISIRAFNKTNDQTIEAVSKGIALFGKEKGMMELIMISEQKGERVIQIYKVWLIYWDKDNKIGAFYQCDDLTEGDQFRASFNIIVPVDQASKMDQNTLTDIVKKIDAVTKTSFPGFEGAIDLRETPINQCV